MEKRKRKRKSRPIPPDTEAPLTDALPSSDASSVATEPGPLSNLSIEELSSMSDMEFQGKIRHHARSRTDAALATIEDVMHNSDDDQARLLAANRYLKLAKAEEEERASALPFGVSEEVFRIALAGLGEIAQIAALTSPSAILRDVSPAPADPRPIVPDDSPLNAPKAKQLRASRLSDDDYEVPEVDVIEENLSVEEE